MSRLLLIIFSLALFSCASHQVSNDSNTRVDLESGTFVSNDENSAISSGKQSQGIHYTFDGVIYPDEHSAAQATTSPIIVPKAKAASSSSYSSSGCHYVKVVIEKMVAG